MLALTVGTVFIARMEAIEKAPMKPNLMPVFFRISSLYCFRISMSADMSTSLKVVSEAAVFWDCLRRSAILRRIRFIFTLCSPRLPNGAADLDVSSCFAAGDGLLSCGLVSDLGCG